MEALLGIEDVGVNRRVLHRSLRCYIAVFQSIMQQFSLPWWIPERSTFDWERLFPHGGTFPHGGRWGYMMLPIGLTGIPLAGNRAYLGRAVAKTRYLEVIAK